MILLLKKILARPAVGLPFSMTITDYSILYAASRIKIKTK